MRYLIFTGKFPGHRYTFQSSAVIVLLDIFTAFNSLDKPKAPRLFVTNSARGEFPADP